MASNTKAKVDITQPSAPFIDGCLEEVFEHIRKMNKAVDIRKVVLEPGCLVTYEIICLRKTGTLSV